jgi:malonyl-CoA O-methyltransferase
MLRYRALRTLKYWKPIQTGIELDDDTETVRELARCDERELHLSGIRLPGPLAPYLAAELSGTRVTIAGLTAHVANQPHQAKSTRWVVEGAGGLLVPINESEYMIDLIAALGMPVLIAARSSLGTINHTLLTLAMLRHRQLEVAGVVMVGARNKANRDAIEKFGSVPVIDEMPQLTPLTQETFGRWATSEFDTRGQLERYFK